MFPFRSCLPFVALAKGGGSSSVGTLSRDGNRMESNRAVFVQPATIVGRVASVARISTPILPGVAEPRWS